MAVYDPTLKLLTGLPQDRTINLAVRHSRRYPILKLEDVDTAPLTPEGIRVAEEFGEALADLYQPGKLETSEIGRCVDTGTAIARGANWKLQVIPEPRLTYTFVDNAWHQRHDHLRLPSPLPAEVQSLATYLSLPASQNRHLNLFVTHDSVLGCLAGYLFNELVDEQNWPHFLEGMAFWHDNGGVFAAWRERVVEISDLM